MITYTSPDKIIKTIRQNDPDFYIHNGFVTSPRVGFEISNKCPSQYKFMLIEAMKNGWIEPIAYMKESEFVWEKIGE